MIIECETWKATGRWLIKNDGCTILVEMGRITRITVTVEEHSVRWLLQWISLGIAPW